MVRGRTLVRLVAVAVLLLMALVGGWIAGRAGIGSVVEPESLTDLERQFVADMEGAALVGRFTVSGREDRPATPERYEIESVQKVGEDQWRFNARLTYGSVDTTLPIVVPMRFLGDTPVITLTDMGIPGLGAYTARVMFYRDRYAGTWQGGRVGGHMFGTIEKSRPAGARE